MLTKNFRCKICDYGMDHPVDACPICGDTFYWLVIPAHEIQEPQKTAFLQTMEDRSPDQVSRDFLNHGGQLWLPYSFWHNDPRGDVLDSFPWIGEVVCIQHEDAGKKLYYEEQVEQKENKSDQGQTEFKEFDTQPNPIIATVKPPKKPNFEPVAISARSGADWSWSKLFAPLMIFSFFVLISLGYFNLLRIKNNRGGQHDIQVLP